MMLWTDANVRTAKSILRKYPINRFREAVEEIENALGREVTPHALRSAFLRRGEGAPSELCRPYESETVVSPSTAPSEMSELMLKLVAVTKRGPVDFATLCDKLDLSPSKTKEQKLGTRVGSACRNG